MKDAMLYFARCNRAINQAMNQTIQKHSLDPAEVKLEGYFFKSLLAILEHVLVSDLIWMKAFADVDSHGLDVAAAVAPVPGYGDKILTSYSQYLELRTKLDDFIIAYVEKTTDEDWSKKIIRRTRAGDLMEKDFYKSMLHFFNHQTHHRGQVSSLLDERGLENNWSNMIFLDV